ncbi:hypothetical protein OEW28_04210 [Defluviimonas sp. WL0002]|uniref:Bestrophin n=1 Tax=Albidovulum marisflavi TaxID=2984159 RepID=A0ABT2Z9M1_9RHOB|nr:bestrophin family ion channel [Defluviimonas sp. WL0002]MCV2867823.1 hypothetical protein [Defluviimonas sp. WL0002]
MIVRDAPSLPQLLFAIKGSIIIQIAPRMLFFALYTAAVLGIDRSLYPLPHVSIAAMGIFGVALSLFLGFRNNAAYDRWWEARKLWGGMIADVRSLGRELLLFLGEGPARAKILKTTVAFAHLHRGWLRQSDTVAEARRTDPAAGDYAARRNPPDAALRELMLVLEAEAAAGRLSDMGRRTLAERLASLTLAQAGCERIAGSPLPFVYSLLVLRTSYLYCTLLPFALIETAGWFAPVVSAIVAYVFFGLSAVTDELEHPFRDVVNGLPLDAMCRVIEISVAEALGEAAAEPMRPVDGVLS